MWWVGRPCFSGEACPILGCLCACALSVSLLPPFLILLPPPLGMCGSLTSQGATSSWCPPCPGPLPRPGHPDAWHGDKADVRASQQLPSPTPTGFSKGARDHSASLINNRGLACVCGGGGCFTQQFPELRGNEQNRKPPKDPLSLHLMSTDSTSSPAPYKFKVGGHPT